MPRSANARGDGIDGITLPIDPRIARQGTTLGLSAELKLSAVFMAGPDLGRGSTRQVTTATPGRLDFMSEQARR